MPQITWALHGGRPTIEIVLTLALGGKQTTRVLLADTGAGSEQSAFELLLDENDCLICGGNPTKHTRLRGAYSGSFPIYGIRVDMPLVGFSGDVEVVAVPGAPSVLDGIAGFRFLNRFTYGNFGNRGHFGLET